MQLTYIRLEGIAQRHLVQPPNWIWLLRALSPLQGWRYHCASGHPVYDEKNFLDIRSEFSMLQLLLIASCPVPVASQNSLPLSSLYTPTR